MSFDALAWINRRYSVNLSFKANPQVLSFSILWNIFEREKCNNNFSTRTIKKILRGKDLRDVLGETDSMLTFYRKRYVSNNQVNSHFHSLHLRNSDNPQLLEKVLLGINDDVIAKVFCIITIISRFRNNLFHGLKDLTELSQQEQLFDKNNYYISRLIENL